MDAVHPFLSLIILLVLVCIVLAPVYADGNYAII
jgi:hypothetical protein